MKIKINQGVTQSSNSGAAVAEQKHPSPITIGERINQVIAEDYGDEEPVYIPESATKRPDTPMVSREDVLDFTYFPEIARDEISVKNIQHTKETIKAEQDNYEERKSAEEAAERKENTKTSIGFYLGLIYLVLAPLTGIVLAVIQQVGMILLITYVGDVAGVVVSILDMAKGGKKKALPGMILCLAAVIIVIGCWVVGKMYMGL